LRANASIQRFFGDFLPAIDKEIGAKSLSADACLTSQSGETPIQGLYLAIGLEYERTNTINRLSTENGKGMLIHRQSAQFAVGKAI
jgi:hypothetical protein